MSGWRHVESRGFDNATALRKLAQRMHYGSDMNTVNPTAAMMTVGATFLKAQNDAARPGQIVWVKVVVLGPTMETETVGVDVWQVKLPDGSSRWAALCNLVVAS